MVRDLYLVLGVKPTASADAIKRAYRRLVKRYHPDVNKARTAKEMFLEVKEAYEVLSNPLFRREYDERNKDHCASDHPTHHTMVCCAHRHANAIERSGPCGRGVRRRRVVVHQARAATVDGRRSEHRIARRSQQQRAADGQLGSRRHPELGRARR